MLKYQSLWDWVMGRWRCPRCGNKWESMSFLSDATCSTIQNGKIIEKRYECPICGFKEVVK